jgi:NACHT domain- and WD repeat-containing protein
LITEKAKRPINQWCWKLVVFFFSRSQLTKINHHRGPVTAVKISAASDVLVSSSTDASVCLWSLDDYSLLNTIQLNKPILNIQISSDSIFLLAHCDDNGLYLRTLATGTDLHALKGHKSKVRLWTRKNRKKDVYICN